MAEGTASGVPREAFHPGDLAFPPISAPRARPIAPGFSPSKQKHSKTARQPQKGLLLEPPLHRPSLGHPSSATVQG